MTRASVGIFSCMLPRAPPGARSRADRISGRRVAASKLFPGSIPIRRSRAITDWSMIARLRRIGIEPGKSFDAATLRPEIRSALDRAPGGALGSMQEKIPTLARVINGWQMNTDTMGVYGDYYLKRA